MKIFNTDILGLKIIELDTYKDERGYFVERFNQNKFQELGLPINYFQDNYSSLH
jgi:dTDP-4-dehydrorhamnose 3,5-epimerase